MTDWSVDKIVGLGLIAALLIAIAGGIWGGANDAWTLGRDIVVGLLGYMKGVEHIHKGDK